MSKQKRKKRHDSNRIKPQPSKPPAKKKWSDVLDHKLFGLLLYAAIFIILFVIAVWKFAQNPDFQNPLVANQQGLIRNQYLIFVLISLCLGYFGFRHFERYRPRWRADRLMWIVTFLAVIALYYLGFQEEVSPNGDNAEYIIVTKSLVEHGQALRLESPGQTPNTLAALGLPMLLTPIYKIWGLDFVKMKILVMTLGLLCFLLLYLIFRREQGAALATVLALAGVTSPYLMGNATDIMTEAPFLFWSLLAIIFVEKFRASERFSPKYLGILMVCIIMSILTRTVGISLLAALILLLAWDFVRDFQLHRSEPSYKTVKSEAFKKFMYLTIPLVLAITVWQLWQYNTGTSQASIFFGGNLAERLEYNTTSGIRVLSQMLFNVETYRFYNFHLNSSLAPLGLLYVILLFVLIWGLLKELRRATFFAWYSTAFFVTIMFASLTFAEMVIMRYISVLIPMMIYFVFIGTYELVQALMRRVNLSKGHLIANVVSVLLLCWVVLTSMRSNAVNIDLAYVGNGPSYQDYIDVAKWAGRNLPPEAHAVAAKPRLFYIFSGVKCTRLSTIQDDYSGAFEEEKIHFFKSRGITHMVLDGISGATRENIFPIVQNREEMFRTLYVGAISGTSSVEKLIYQPE